MEKTAPFFRKTGYSWTAGVALPGGDSAVDGVTALTTKLEIQYPFLSPRWAARLIKGYGTGAVILSGDAKSASDLGTDFGATLTVREVTWLTEKKYARTADDIVWRRSKLGLRMTVEKVAALDVWVKKTLAE